MLQSLQDYGQLSPVVVCQLDGELVLVDGFKRLRAARSLGALHDLSDVSAGVAQGQARSTHGTPDQEVEQV